MTDKAELHLFCLWKRGISAFDAVSRMIGERFTVPQVEDVSWSNVGGLRGMCRFYTNSAWIVFWKYLRCGGVPVRLIVVRDDAPRYAARDTNQGARSVNVNIFDTKMALRKLLRNGHLIHATDSSLEFAFNYAVLTGAAPDVPKLLAAPPWDGTVRRLEASCPERSSVAVPGGG